MRAFRFELTKVQVPAIRERVVSQLVNINADLAARVADGLGIAVPKAQQALKPVNARAEVKTSKSLSLMARPGDGGIRTRRIAILVADGVDGEAVTALHATLSEQGAVPRFVGPKLGSFDGIDVEVTLEASPAVLYDAVVIPDGEAASSLAEIGLALEFIKDQYRHCKPMLVLGSGERLLEAAGIPAALPDDKPDPGILLAADAEGAAMKFIAAIARHRHFERQTDPPRI